MLTNDDVKHWTPHPRITEKVARGIAEGARVLEIGPGAAPFARATHFVDWRPGPNAVTCDLNWQLLPFANKEFDFVYCRHVVEDLYNPFLVCAEMSRVAKAGYIETPSPLAELCKGVDANSPPWRGYHHHRYVVWVEDGKLHFTAKYPLVERLAFDDEAAFGNALRSDPFLWSSYYFWEGAVEWRLLQHDVDYHLMVNYKDTLLRATRAGLVNARETAPV